MWLSESHRAPGYRFQYQVPPTPPAASYTRTDKPIWFRSRCSMYRPENPAPITTASNGDPAGGSIDIATLLWPPRREPPGPVPTPRRPCAKDEDAPGVGLLQLTPRVRNRRETTLCLARR